MTNDTVSHPKHYTNGHIETIDYIHDQLTEDEWRGYIKGNVLKYISRERHKGGLEDIRKALWYLNRYVESKSMKDTVSIVDALTMLSTKPTVRSGITAQSPLQQEKKLNSKSEETTTETNELDQRVAVAMEKQVDLLESLLKQNDCLIKLRAEELSTSASQECRITAGDIVITDSIVRPV